jgi:hypothetical protein
MGEGTDMTTKTCEYVCLKKCDHHYCINERLMLARNGDTEDGLIFSGENTYKMSSILSVAEIFRQFKKQAEAVYREGRGFSPAV